MKVIGSSKPPESDFIDFGDFCRNEIGIQCQYGSHYLCGGIPGIPHLGKGLRIKGTCKMYHDLMIHKDDAPIFKQRYEQYRKEAML